MCPRIRRGHQYLQLQGDLVEHYMHRLKVRGCLKWKDFRIYPSWGSVCKSRWRRWWWISQMSVDCKPYLSRTLEFWSWSGDHTTHVIRCSYRRRGKQVCCSLLRESAFTRLKRPFRVLPSLTSQSSRRFSLVGDIFLMLQYSVDPVRLWFFVQIWRSLSLVSDQFCSDNHLGSSISFCAIWLLP